MIISTQEKLKQDHLNRKHKDYDAKSCVLCENRRIGRENPPFHLVPPLQDPTQKDMQYIKEIKRDANIAKETK